MVKPNNEIPLTTTCTKMARHLDTVLSEKNKIQNGPTVNLSMLLRRYKIYIHIYNAVC